MAEISGGAPEHDELKTQEIRDKEWLTNVYQGDVPQLTVRAVITGCMLGGIMSLSNLYVGLKSGWGLGVDIVAVILAFAIWKGLSSLLPSLVKREFTMMENTIMMTCAVAASWISSAGLVSAVPALTMVTGKTFVWWHLILWISSILFLGLFMAIPLSRQMITVEQLRFPGNIPTAETLRAMYSKGAEAMKKAKALGSAGFLGIIVASFRDGFGYLPGMFPAPFSIARVSLANLTLQIEPGLIMMGIGALFGIKVGLSMLFGALLNYGVLAPYLINHDIVKHPAPMIRALQAPQFPLTINQGQQLEAIIQYANSTHEFAGGARTDTLTYVWTQPRTYEDFTLLVSDLNAPQRLDGSVNPFYHRVSFVDTLRLDLGSNVLRARATPDTLRETRFTISGDTSTFAVAGLLGFTSGASRYEAIGGFRNIVAWSMWPGAAVLVVAGLLGLIFQYKTLGRTFGSVFSGFRKKKEGAPHDVLEGIAVPMTWFIMGFIVTGIICLILQMAFFGIHWYMGILAVLLTFFLAAVAARASAEVGINPIGAMGKVTQLLYGLIAPGNMTTNLMTANVTAGAASSCSDTVGNLFVGNKVGAHPRKQFIAQLFGVVAGALFAVPAYYLLVPDASVLGGAKFPAPAAIVWAGVARVLSQGLNSVPMSARYAALIAIFFGIIIVTLEKIFPKIKPYTPSPTALGIALTIPAYNSLSMFIGSAIVWILEKRAPSLNDMYTIPVASGVIAGESLTGVAIAALMAAGIIG
ncbi:MAG: OPT/YSL family transporter [bacterium]|nr:OPT/YSL family transporter [bacterium]